MDHLQDIINGYLTFMKYIRMIKILIYSDRSSNLLTKRELIWLNDYINKEKRNILSKVFGTYKFNYRKEFLVQT